MFLELIAAVAAGLAGAGLALLVMWISKGRLPRWIVPVTAGVCMIGYAIVMEYTWFKRQTEGYPDGVEVTNTKSSSAFWRPWTYAWPIVDGFTAVDMLSVQTNDGVPEQRIADVFFFQRWKKGQKVRMVFDCAEKRVAPMVDTITFDDRGAVSTAAWAPLPADDPTLETLCKEI